MAVKKEAYDVKVQIRFENGTDSYRSEERRVG